MTEPSDCVASVGRQLPAGRGEGEAVSGTRDRVGLLRLTAGRPHVCTEARIRVDKVAAHR